MQVLTHIWIIRNGVISETIAKINWDTESAMIVECASNTSYVGHKFPKELWTITLDAARLTARKQVERIYKSLESDPIEQSTWEPYLKAVKEGGVIINRLE